MPRGSLLILPMAPGSDVRPLTAPDRHHSGDEIVLIGTGAYG
jgi:hypothetical protein